MAGRFPQGLVAAPKEKRKAGAELHAPQLPSARTARIFLARARTRSAHRDEYLGFSPQDWFLETMSLEDDTPEKAQKCIVRRGVFSKRIRKSLGMVGWSLGL